MEKYVLDNYNNLLNEIGCLKSFALGYFDGIGNDILIRKILRLETIAKRLFDLQEGKTKVVKIIEFERGI